jgi:hypothetical protein
MFEQYIREWNARDIEESARDKLLKERKKLDEGSPRSWQQDVDVTEAQNIERMNRKPLTIDTSTPGKIVFNARFQARFEDPAQKGDFATLKAAVEAGAQMVWQKQEAAALPGRSFALVPEVTQVSETAKRDQNFWLITVRPSNESKPAYPGCTFPPSDELVAVTLADCDGGVINVPPKLVGNAYVLGHEMLHLFGLIDRYTRIDYYGTKVSSPEREVGNRPDPLASKPGEILDEDLAFLLDNLGVYAGEEYKGRETLRKLEKEKGLSLRDVERELERWKIIRDTGHDPRVLTRPRTDFVDKAIKAGENQ